MNRRYALWQHEWKSMRWFLGISILCAITTCVLMQQAIVSELTFYEEYEFNYAVYGTIFCQNLLQTIYIGAIWVFPFFAIMSAFHFRDKQSRGTREYFMSLPYSKNERFWIKVVMGYGTITAFVLVLTVGVLIVWNQVMPMINRFNAKWPVSNVELPKETVGDVMSTLLVCWLLLLALYSVFVLMQTIVNQGVLAAVFSVIAVLSPFCALAGIMNIQIIVMNTCIMIITK